MELIPGCTWCPNGQTVLTGPALGLFAALDELFLGWAERWQPRRYQFPAFIPARELAKIDYLRSFPHLATFPVTLADSPSNLDDFIGSLDASADAVELGQLSATKCILTPAACYHVYVVMQGQELEAPAYVTTRACCHRREKEYQPLRRQWSFSMREFVCIGTADEVRTFVSCFREVLEAEVAALELPITWEQASDPFYQPDTDPKFVAQRLLPLKTELKYRDLPLGSINCHQSHFGSAFDISIGGEPAHSGCVAFGLERWMGAIADHFGPRESDWPAALAAPAAKAPANR